MTAIIAASMGATQPLVLTVQEIIESGAGNQTARYQVDSDGNIKDQDGTVLERWNNTGADGVNFEVRFTSLDTVGSAPTGSATETWLTLDADRYLEVTDTTAGAGGHSVTTFIAQLGNAGTSTALKSAFIRIEAERT